MDAKAKGHTTLTPRAAVLALAVAFVIVAVALPFKIWLGQRGQINSLTAQTHDAQARVSELTAEHQRWSDPSYVEAQAHKRLHYIVPGKKSVVVLNGPSHHSRQTTTRTITKAAPDEAWYSQLWQSMQAAGATPTHRK